MFDIQQFENEAHESGVRYWLAHEFMHKLGYDNWSLFKVVIQKSTSN